MLQIPVRFQRPLSVIASSYAKRWLDTKVYDRLPEQKFFQKLIALPKSQRLGLESLLYAITATLNEVVTADGLMGSAAKDIALDAAPELGKRLVNGAPHNGGNGHDRTVKSLDAAQRKELGEWLNGLDPQARTQVVGTIARLTLTEMEVLLVGNREYRLDILEVLAPERVPLLKRRIAALDALTQRLREHRIARLNGGSHV